MILNILLIIILLVVFFRIIFKSRSESYENPFTYDSNPIIDKNKLSYTPPPYIQTTDAPSLAEINAINGFVEKNNKLIMDYADDSNFIINDSSVDNVKLLSFIEKQVINKFNNKCMQLNNNQEIITDSCNTTNNKQKWSLIDNYIKNKETNTCLSYNGVLLNTNNCEPNDSNEWITDTKGRIHSLNKYDDCLSLRTVDNNVIVEPCSDTNTQEWYN